MTRIAFLSPQPPTPTGVATYAAEVLRGLRRRGLGDRHGLEAPWPLGGRTFEAVDRSDLAVYHVGNNAEFHGEIYRLAVSRPGLLVLHDLALDDLVRWFLDAGDPMGHAAEAEADAARLGLFERRPDIEGPLATPWCAHVVRRSRGVIVHSEFGRGYLEAIGSRTPVFVVPHPVIEPPRAARRAEERAARLRTLIAQPFLVGVLGDVGGAKGIEAVLTAAGELGPETAVVIAGRRIPGYDVVEAVAASGVADRVTVALDVSERDFHAWLHAADAVVNLRHPHRGEVSGTLVRAMAAGKPVVVQSVGTYLDWPRDSVVRIAAGEPDPGELAVSLQRLRDDPAWRDGIGRNARAYTDRLRSEDATAAGYVAAIEETLSLTGDPARLAEARWASALAQLGAGPDAAGLAERQVESIEEIAGAPAPGVEWAGDSGRYG
ncbi:MAG: glycosyltransferase [Actinomycetota bacterium]|nr:glycosyltransferase [Actinomycetota bacterium]